MPFIKTDRGINWHYDCRGTGGESLLFIHGWAADRRIWSQQIEHFSRSFKVLSIDLPGHGKTPWHRLTLDEIVEEIDFLIEDLDIKKVNIVASSMGGLLAIKYERTFPQKVKKIVLVGSVPKFVKTKKNHSGLTTEQIKKLNEQVACEYPGILQVFFRSLFTIQERENGKIKWLITFRQGEDLPNQEALQYFLQVLEAEDLTPVLGNVNVPVELISGCEDYICPKEATYRLKEHLKQARIDYFAQCGHFPFLSKAKKFNEIVEKFLNTPYQKTSHGN